ncbi:IS110 family RNA-guided transposase [Phaeovulum vinaykumarii]|uniref:IS110 family transposase n=1 Tax=Phaeovulum vinaykumarii TaxID=407234 RepID=UPI000BC6154A|nr:IS110 family transposase [Phaeovulum vinaykumarii]SOC20569.1 transposase [Phaeovulum vinaykumarii]
MNDTIGVDISKASLEVWRLSDRKHMRFSNDKAGLRELCKWLGPDPVRVVYEATGRFHRDLEAAVAKAGHGPVKVNPSRARRFAQATGNIAKTDRVDARMLAQMGSTLALEATPIRSQSMHEIKELHVARVALIKDRTACRNRLDTARNKVVLSQLKARERQIDKQIAQIDAELVRLIKADPELARRYEILISIRGIGPVAATAMIVDMPELGTMTPKEAASLAGLAPVTRQSGSWKGKARIFGGRHGLRTLLFMPAVIATRYNAPLRKIYLALYEGGKPWKVAITAVMRKLIVLANALIRDNRKWAEIAP